MLASGDATQALECVVRFSADCPGRVSSVLRLEFRNHLLGCRKGHLSSSLWRAVRQIKVFDIHEGSSIDEFLLEPGEHRRWWLQGCQRFLRNRQPEASTPKVFRRRQDLYW